MSGQPSPAPSDFVPYNATNTNGPVGQPQFPPSTFPTSFSAAGSEGGGYGTVDRFGHAPALHQLPVREKLHDAVHFNDESNRLAPLTGYHEPMGAPLLPPMQIVGRGSDDAGLQSHGLQEQRPQSDQEVNEESTGGGVSPVLDYEMDTMVAYVTEMAQKLINPTAPWSAAFEKWVRQVLVATRLPSATISMAFFYLAVRMSSIDKTKHNLTEPVQLYRLVIVAFMLGSKFLDDNTFINKSWAQVSTIDVHELSALEREWLRDIFWSLHCDPNVENGYNVWREHWKTYEKELEVRKAFWGRWPPYNTPVQQSQSVDRAWPNTSLHAQRPGNPSFSDYGNAISQPLYPTATFDTWYRRSENPPPSAISMGATGSEHYGGPGIWGPPGSRYGASRWPQVQSQQNRAYSQPVSANYPHLNSWFGHSNGYNSAYCSSRQQISYFGNPAYRMQSVMG
ncbi:MAG: hypothetical protein Q9165_001164 [Trypethelium subeluteriae]